MNLDTARAAMAANPPFWTAPRVRMLETICPLISGTQVDSTALQRIAEALKQERQALPRIQKLRLALVLEELCYRGVLESAVLPEVPLRVPRPSVLPASPQAFRLLSSFTAMREYLWDGWLAQARPAPDRAFALVIVLGIEAGLAGRMWLRLLTRLTWEDVGAAGRIEFPIHWLDESARRAVIHVPPSVVALLHHLRETAPEAAASQPVFLPERRGIKARAREFESMLETTYDRFLAALGQQHPGIRWPDWQQFAQYAPLIALFEGIDEPWLLSALRQAPLATSLSCPPGLPILATDPGPPPTLISHVAPQRRTRLPGTNAWRSVPVSPASADDAAADSDWCGAALQLLRRFLAEVDATLKRRATARQAEQLRPLFARYRRHADALAPARSALHLALDFAEHKLIEQRLVKPKSLRKYLRLLFEEGLLADPDGRDLSVWEREDHEQFIDRMFEIRRAPASTAFLLDKLGQLYRFALARGYCAEAPAIPFLANWVGGSGRPWIIGLHQFDAFLRLRLEAGTREDRLMAVATILAFHGGARAEEAVSLNLNDVLVADGEVWIWIRRGKTAAARRAIPLHWLAPESATAVVAAWAAERRAEFRDDAILDRIGLFGPEKDRNRYDYDSLIGNLVERLKDSFGEGADYHLLRHSFASWLFLRWYAARHADFASTLHEGHHELFQPAAMRKLAHFFTLRRHDRLPPHSASDLIMISKLIGHSGLETFFASYVHTLDAVQHHVRERLARRFGGRELPGKTIAVLFPGLRSRSTQARLMSRTINDLVRRREAQGW